MSNEFTQTRIRSFLSKYEQKIDALMENEDDLTDPEMVQQVKEIMSELESEKALAKQTNHDLLQETNYIPAIDEALNFLDQSLEEAGTEQFDSNLYDAKFSLSYYQHL